MRREKQGKVMRVRVRVRTQRDVVRDVMLSANECGAWLTLAELGAMTRYPATSISAQLRHLKKPKFGNYELEKQPRVAADAETGHGVEWEYRLTRRRRVVRARARRRKGPVDGMSKTTCGVTAAPPDFCATSAIC
jgi:hypothetical protein